MFAGKCFAHPRPHQSDFVEAASFKARLISPDGNNLRFYCSGYEVIIAFVSIPESLHLENDSYFDLEPAVFELEAAAI